MKAKFKKKNIKRKPLVNRPFEISDERLILLGARLSNVYHARGVVRLNPTERELIEQAYLGWQRTLALAKSGRDLSGYLTSLDGLLKRIEKRIWPKKVIGNAKIEEVINAIIPEREKMVKRYAKGIFEQVLDEYKFPKKLRDKLKRVFNEDVIMMRYKTARNESPTSSAYYIHSEGKIVIDPFSPEWVDDLSEEIIHFIHLNVNKHRLGILPATEFLAALHTSKESSEMKSRLRRLKEEYKKGVKKHLRPVQEIILQSEIESSKAHKTYDDAANIVKAGMRDKLVKSYGYRLFTMHPVQLLTIGKVYGTLSKMRRHLKNKKKKD